MQAERWGAELHTEDVESIDLSSRPFTITSSERTVKAHSVIIATGATAKRLNIPSEEKVRLAGGGWGGGRMRLVGIRRAACVGLRAAAAEPMQLKPLPWIILSKSGMQRAAIVRYTMSVLCVLCAAVLVAWHQRVCHL